MTEAEVLTFARKKMQVYDLLDKGWSVDVFQARRIRGQCRPQSKKIRISRYLINQAPTEGVEDTVLHEIAHALHWERYGEGGHGKDWKQIAREVGARPVSCVQMDYENPGFRWMVHCLACKAFKTGRYRKSKLIKSVQRKEKRYLCPRCQSSQLGVQRISKNFVG